MIYDLDRLTLPFSQLLEDRIGPHVESERLGVDGLDGVPHVNMSAL